jgi:hypothetical protein
VTDLRFSGRSYSGRGGIRLGVCIHGSREVIALMSKTRALALIGMTAAGLPAGADGGRERLGELGLFEGVAHQPV